MLVTHRRMDRLRRQVDCEFYGLAVARALEFGLWQRRHGFPALIFRCVWDLYRGPPVQLPDYSVRDVSGVK